MSHIFRFLTDDGLVGDGTNEIMVGAADVYYAGPPSGKIWEVARIIVHVEDAGNSTWSTFGTLSALTNGCKLEKRRGGPAGQVELDFLDGHTIKKNGDWASFCYDCTIESPNSGVAKTSARWTFSKAGEPLKLNGGLNEKLVFTTQDVTTGLEEFHIQLQGIEKVA